MRYIIAFLVWFLFPSLALSVDESSFIYKQDKNWLLACNNVQACSAIGLPNADVYNGQEWYVHINWDVTSRSDLIFNLDFFELSAQDSIELCTKNFDCKNLPHETLYKDNYLERRVYATAKLERSSLLMTDYLRVKKAGDTYLLNIEYFKNNFNKILLSKYFPYKTNDALKIIDFTAGTKTDFIKKSIKNENDISYLKFENNDEIVFVRDEDDGVKDTFAAYKFHNNKYEPFKALDDYTTKIIGNWGAAPFGVAGLVIDRHDSSQIHLTNMQGLYSCGIDFGMGYNGEQLFIKTIKIMPICTNIELNDWLSVYEN